MSTKRQERPAKKNIEKPQQAWKMSRRQHATARPEGRPRAKPGAGGEGNYYRIQVRPKEGFVAFRYHDVGRPGHTLRLGGKRANGSWDDVAWLISKEDAHVANEALIADTAAARQILKVVGPAKHVKGDIFVGQPRRNVPEKKKPTPAQRRAQLQNIRKAQAVRRKRPS